MRRRIILTQLPLLLLVLAGSASAYVRDVRVEELEVLRTDPATVRTADGQWQRTRNDVRWGDFASAHGSAWRVRWNELTGTPHRVFGGDLPAVQVDARFRGQALDRAGILSLSESFVRQQRALIGVDWENLQPAFVEFRGGRWVVTLKQMVNGIEVFGGRVPRAESFA
jgi:hypothetical protein